MTTDGYALNLPRGLSNQPGTPQLSVYRPLGIARAVALIVLGAAPAEEAAVLRHGASVSERNALIVEVRVALTARGAVFVEYAKEPCAPQDFRARFFLLPLCRFACECGGKDGRRVRSRRMAVDLAPFSGLKP